LLTVIASFFLLIAAPQALAQPPAGYEKIYGEPTNVNLGGRPVVADIALYADRKAAKQSTLKLALVTDVTDFIAQTEKDLETWVAAHQEKCGERWGAGKPFIGFPEGAIRFAVDVELEVWACDRNGRPFRLAEEAGRVDVTLVPYVANGKLQARLGDFSVEKRRGVSKYLPLEFVARRVLDGELKKLNENRKFWRPPRPLFDEGFRYEAIGAKRSVEERVVITARYVGEGPEAKLKSLVDRVRKEGLTQ
jgi:hypothetical protein